MTKIERHNGNWATSLKKIADAKQGRASVAKVLSERVRQGFFADICQDGCFGVASFNEVNGRILATREEFNPLINYSDQVVKSMLGGEFYLTDEIKFGAKPYTQILEEIADEDRKLSIGKRRVIDLGKIKTQDVPTDCFGDDETIAFLAEGKRNAKKYGLFLRNKIPEESRLNQITEYHQNLIGKNKSTGLWLFGLVGSFSSGFSCDGGGIGYDGGSLFGGMRRRDSV